MHMNPSPGCDLKRVFAATPMGLYQPGSGALYPALRRLEYAGSCGRPRDVHRGAGAAHR
jgi:DNA-binding PadR family transcriptional regulator